MAVYNLGRIIPTLRGEYSPSTTYYKMDVVYYNGTSYICKSNSPIAGRTPSASSSYWQKMAAAGESVGVTPAQVQEIISSVTTNMQGAGYVIDNDYAQFKNETETALGNLPTVNNGKLTLYTNGNKMGEFTANQSTDLNIYLNAETSRGADLSFYEASLSGDTAIQNQARFVEIQAIKPNYIYVIGNIVNTMVVKNPDSDFTEMKKCVENMIAKSTFIIFGCEKTGAVQDMLHFANLYVDYNGISRLGTTEAGYRYIIEVNGFFVKLTEYKTSV